MTGVDDGVHLERNLAALDRHRPAVAAVLRARLAEGVASGYRVDVEADGRGVVKHADTLRTPGGPAAEKALREALAKPNAAVIGGIGDGRVLPLLAPRTPGPHGSTQAVYLCEPDLDRLLAGLALADLSADNGPIASDAVMWFVGTAWAEAYRDALAGTSLLPAPDIQVRLGTGSETEAVWAAASAARKAAEAQAAEAARAWGTSCEPDELADLFGPGAPRTPRVLLIASRFTTVVRHSVAEAARGFTALGWDALVCTEEADHERLCPEAVLRSLAGFRPDLIVAVNYHRHHFSGLPGGVPFVCWIQDDMLHLIEPGAGDRLGERDFVMSAWAHRYVHEWGYPAARCVVVPRMTDVASLPPGIVRDEELRDDLVYVSSHSARPREVLDRLTAAAGGHTPGARATARAGEALMDVYARGESVANPRKIRELLTDAARSEGMETPDGAWLSRVTELLALHLNNRLYRQQGLGWAASVAKERGLTLAVYGPGWEHHPDFAAHARGPVGREALVGVTRTARFNLRLEPYPAMCHQRLIEALAAGGAVLSRRFSAGEQPEAALVSFFLRHIAHRSRRTAGLAGLLSASELATWNGLVDAYKAVFPHLAGADMVLFMSERHEQGTLADYEHSAHPPEYFRTVFGDAAELDRVVSGFLSDPSARRTTACAQQADVRDRFGYGTGLQRLVSILGQRLREQARVPCRSDA